MWLFLCVQFFLTLNSQGDYFSMRSFSVNINKKKFCVLFIHAHERIYPSWDSSTGPLVQSSKISSLSILLISELMTFSFAFYFRNDGNQKLLIKFSVLMTFSLLFNFLPLIKNIRPGNFRRAHVCSICYSYFIVLPSFFSELRLASTSIRKW